MKNLQQWLKTHFIPHSGNDHRPKLLERRMVTAIALLAIALQVAALLVPMLMREYEATLSAVLPGVVSALTNEERREAALPPLAVSEALNRAAQLKAEDMAAKGYFAHQSPDGTTPWYWLKQVGYEYSYAGENLAVDFADSRDITEAWMNSPSHRENIVHEAYREVGTGIATGIYKGKEAVFVVQFYATPAGGGAVVDEGGSSGATMSSEHYIVQEVPDEVAPSSNMILGAATSAGKALLKPDTVAPTFIDKITVSPRHTIELVIYGAIFLAGFALLLNVLVAFKVQHMDLIINGTLVLALLFGLLALNTHLGRSADITQSAAAISVLK